MDDFVRNKLTEWGLSEWIESFKEHGINQENIYYLKDDDIAKIIPQLGPAAKCRNELSLLKEENSTSQTHQDTSGSGQVEASTSKTRNKRKRELDSQGKSDKQLSKKRRRETAQESYTDNIILSDVKKIMASVKKRLPAQNNKFIQFLETKIEKLKTDKKYLVGVFGKTGAGKSSLINAIIEEKKLLPSGDVSACTSVMIKVEANKIDDKYEAEIEFITKEEWKDELWLLLNFLRDNTEQEDDTEQDEDLDGDEKLTALYGDEWKDKTHETLMELKYFKEIPEFLKSEKKILKYETAAELSVALGKYTRTQSKVGASKGVKKWYWPLVKCVTIRVPDNELLQHVTLVDLPGNGDCNKSRDKMWKEEVGNCSTVWIVTEVNRAASEQEPWEILKSAASIMGNGGQCENIYFICTKTDLTNNDDRSTADIRAVIFERNERAKEEVTKKFNKLHNVKKHFHENCFKVFTVSSKEFEKNKRLKPDETEIPKLQEILQKLNDCHSETLNYVSGARGILSLIQGARCKGDIGKLKDLRRNLGENLGCDTGKVKQAMEDTYKSFEKCLSEGVEKSEGSCEQLLHSFLYDKRDGRSFHSILKAVVAHQGTHKPRKGRKGKPINLNAMLASCLTDCIDEKFKKTFPNERACGPFNGVINTFSLDTKKLIHKYKDSELLLTFLKTEEDQIKKTLNGTIRDHKKIIYNSLTTTIEENMKNCYKKATKFKGANSLKNMRTTLEQHVHDSKNIMFKKAKDKMLNLLKELTVEVCHQLKETLLKSIELSLKTDDSTIPDLHEEYNMVNKYYNDLMPSQAADQ